MKIKIDTAGLGKAIADIRSYSEDKVKGVKEVIAGSTATIEGNAVALAPVDEGNLKNSIYSEILDNGFVGRIAASAEYAPYIEWGTGIHATNGGGRQTPWVYFNEKTQQFVFTRGMKAQPFMFPAWEQERPNYIREIRNEMGKIK